MAPKLRILPLAAVLLLSVSAAQAQDEGDHHAGYYYPEPQSSEVYEARVQTLPGDSRLRRIAFITGLTAQLVKGEYAPPFAIFAKGTEAEKLIIVALADGPMDTLYRARGLLANLTSMSRVTAFFREHTVEEEATFFDLLKLLGFEQLTVSDGKTYAHQIFIK